MSAQDQPKAKAKSFGENIESDLALEMLRVVEIAAIESARTMGQGDRKYGRSGSDRGHAPDDGHGADAGHHRHWRRRTRRGPHALYRRAGRCCRFPMGERFRQSTSRSIRSKAPSCATGAPGSITVLAASEKGGLLNAPDCYMEKIVQPSCKI